jgi:FkbM family methyltransferase
MSEDELALIIKLCISRKSSLDIGAYKGEYTAVMSLSTRFVHAFEPVPKRYIALDKKFSKTENVLVYPVALSDSEDKKNLYIPIFRNRFNMNYALDAISSVENRDDYYKKMYSPTYVYSKEVPVESRKLDSYNFNNVGLIKIDVEGHEFEVLNGGKKTIENFLPNIMVEIEERYNPGGHEKVSDWLNNIGYKGFFLFKNDVLTIKEFDVESMQTKPLEKIEYRLTPNIPGYVNNFIFLHESSDLLDDVEKYLRNYV